jgi:hypothetical protein
MYIICLFVAAIGLTLGGNSPVQYTFTHRQYTEQHSETEYTEQNIHNNKKKKNCEVRAMPRREVRTGPRQGSADRASSRKCGPCLVREVRAVPRM